MDEKTSLSPAELLASILDDLNSEEGETRLSGIARLRETTLTSMAILQRLEVLALKDEGQAVRDEASAALDLPANVMARQQRRKGLFAADIKAIQKEIGIWQQQGLIDETLAKFLQRRYTDEAMPASTPVARPAAATGAPAPSVKESLFSGTSISVALYLGAFFVIASALIIAAILDALRIPILFLLAAGFGGGALLLKQRMPQPSFVLFSIATILAIVTGSVITDQMGITGVGLSIFWAVLLTGMTGLWGFSAFMYDSRFFALLSYGSFLWAGAYFAHIFEAPTQVYLLIWSIQAIFGWAVVVGLKKLERSKILGLYQAVLELSALAFLGLTVIYSLPAINDWHIVSVLALLTSAAFYLVGNIVKPRAYFRYMLVFALAPILWQVGSIFNDGMQVAAITLGLSALAYAITSEILPRQPIERLQKYATPALVGMLGLTVSALAAGLAFWAQDENADLNRLPLFLILLAFAGLYAALHVLRPRWWMWTIGLGAALSAYHLLFGFRSIEALNIPFALIAALPTFALLIPEFWLHAREKLLGPWRGPLLAYGFLNGALVFFASLMEENTLLGFGILFFFTLFALAHTIIQNKRIPTYIFTILGAVSIAQLANALNYGYSPLLLTALAIGYHFAGKFLARGASEESNSKLPFDLEISGLTLATLSAFSSLVTTPNEANAILNTILAIIPALAAAGLFTHEAFVRRSVWLGYPANLFYLMAYFIVLNKVNVTEPQFFSVGIAVLGMLMHYLMTRTKTNAVAAFITGMFSQIALLGTTYVQMVANVELIYLSALIFQGLVVIGYGLFIRSRSLVITPIIIIVLGVITVAITLLQVLATIFLVGCTGIALLLLGIFAVAQRDKIGKVGERFNDWNA
jgi:hypothetical protein